MSAGLQGHDFVAGRIDTPRRPYMKLVHNVTEFHDFMHCTSGPIDFVAGANMGFRKERVVALGGFTSGITNAEDTELLIRFRASGGVCHYLSDAIVLHDHSRVRLTEIISYPYEHAQTTIRLRAENPKLTGTPSFMLSPWALRALSVPVAAWSTFRMFARRDGVLRHVETTPVIFMTKVAWCLGAARGLERA
ncbi:MAG: hypothetical protein PF636_09360 [Actinomycetota bacterium]|jgi:GT2 family glycosyltransferase|nr:hypothetical protein [Actinomycetota bacterium]